jgi:uncharacterized protein
MKGILLGPALALLLVSTCLASDLPEARGFVNDYTGRVDRASLEKLAAKTAELKSDKDLEVGVAVVATTGGAPIEQYANQLARKWGVGSKDSNRGVLIVVALDDRTSRIEVSRHFEGVLTDGQAGSILRSARPDFRGGDYGAGLIKIVEGVAVIADTPQADPAAAKAAETEGEAPGLLLGITALIIVFGAVTLPFAGLIAAGILVFRRVKARGRAAGWHGSSLSGTYVGLTGSSADPSGAYESSPPSDYPPGSSESSGSTDSWDSSSSGSSDSGGGFGGSSDFGGGGASDSW